MGTTPLTEGTGRVAKWVARAVHEQAEGRGGKMFQVNGLYGHVAWNNLRSLWVFLGFAVAFQIIGMVVLTPYMMFFDLQRIWFVAPIEYLKVYSLPLFVFGCVYFGLNFFVHVQSMQDELCVEAPSNAERARVWRILEPLAITAGINVPEIGILRTSACNAFVCGWRKSATTLVITRGLLATLNDEELRAVIAHELVHIKNDDIKLMAVANVAVRCIKVLEKLNIFHSKSGKRFFLLIILFPLFFLYLMISLMVNFVMYLGTTLGKVSRLVIASSREFIADAEAVRLTHDSAALISALLKIDGRSTIEGLDPMVEAMMIDGAADGEFATHPTIRERIEALRELTGSMAHVPLSQTIALSPTPGRMMFARDVQSGARDLHGLSRQPDYVEGAARPTFGLRNRPAELSQPIKPEASVFARVNADNEKGMFGIPPMAKYIIQGVLILLVVMQVFTMIMVQNKLGGVEKDLSAAPSISGEKSVFKRIPTSEARAD